MDTRTLPLPAGVHPVSTGQVGASSRFPESFHPVLHLVLRVWLDVYMKNTDTTFTDMLGLNGPEARTAALAAAAEAEAARRAERVAAEIAANPTGLAAHYSTFRGF